LQKERFALLLPRQRRLLVVLLLLSSKVVGALDNKKMKPTKTMAPPNPQIFVHKTKMQNLRNFLHCSHILLLSLLLLFLLHSAASSKSS
jgi:hypothetical protein